MRLPCLSDDKVNKMANRATIISTKFKGATTAKGHAAKGHAAKGQEAIVHPERMYLSSVVPGNKLNLTCVNININSAVGY